MDLAKLKHTSVKLLVYLKYRAYVEWTVTLNPGHLVTMSVGF